MKKLTFALATMVAMASCSNNEIEREVTSNAVRFTTVVGNSTKATTGVIDLTALKASTDGFAVSTSGLGTSDEMSNVAVKYVTSAWTYTGDYFWPINPSQAVNFTAYAPAGTSGVSISGTGVTISSFTPAATASSQIDLLYAPPAPYTRSGSGANGVALNFTHILTQVVFAVSTDIPSGDTPIIASIVLTIPNGTGTYNGTGWVASGSAQSYTVFSNNALSSTAVTSTPLLMIPQTLPAGTNAVVTFSVKGASSSSTVDLSGLTTVKTWAAGTKVTYNITFSNTDLKIKFTDPSVATWTNASDGFIY